MSPPAHWAPSLAAADQLGVSERALHRWRAASLLKPGTHYRRKFPAPNSPILYDLEAVEAVMREAPPVRFSFWRWRDENVHPRH